MNPLNIYGDIFAEVYNLYWTEFIDIVGPQIVEIIENNTTQSNKILDLCCGTGRLSELLLANGFNLTGIDLSPAMINIAKRRCEANISEGTANFKVDDAVSFELDHEVDAIVSTFDSLNHLNGIDDLESCFIQCYEHLTDDGLLIFDINTEKGLRKWDFVDLEDHGDVVFIMHGKYDKKERTAYTKVYGFRQLDEVNTYEKFDETMSNTVFKINKIIDLLQKIGFTIIRITEELDLFMEIENPEDQDRVFFIVKK